MLLLLLLKESYSIDHCVWTRNKELSAVSRWTLLERRQRCRQEQSKNYKWIFLLSSFGCISSRSYYCVSVAIVYAACGDVSLRKTLNVTQLKVIVILNTNDFQRPRAPSFSKLLKNERFLLQNSTEDSALGLQYWAKTSSKTSQNGGVNLDINAATSLTTWKVIDVEQLGSHMHLLDACSQSTS